MKEGIVLPISDSKNVPRQGSDSDSDRFEKAAELGPPASIQAQLKLDNPTITEADEWHILGRGYLRGDNGKPKDYVRAMASFELALASNSNDKDLFDNLGMCYQFGLGVAEDLEKARIYYEKSAEQGCTGAIFSLALLYQYRLNDLVKARTCFEKAAGLGNIISVKCLLQLDNPTITEAEDWYQLGDEYHRGSNGKTQDYVRASVCYKWLALIKNPNHAGSLYRLGLLYERGQGVTRDLEEARAYFEKAAELGYDASQEEEIPSDLDMLGHVVAFGVGLAQVGVAASVSVGSGGTLAPIVGPGLFGSGVAMMKKSVQGLLNNKSATLKDYVKDGTVGFVTGAVTAGVGNALAPASQALAGEVSKKMVSGVGKEVIKTLGKKTVEKTTELVVDTTLKAGSHVAKTVVHGTVDSFVHQDAGRLKATLNSGLLSGAAESVLTSTLTENVTQFSSGILPPKPSAPISSFLKNKKLDSIAIAKQGLQDGLKSATTSGASVVIGNVVRNQSLAGATAGLKEEIIVSGVSGATSSVVKTTQKIEKHQNEVKKKRTAPKPPFPAEQGKKIPTTLEAKLPPGQTLSQMQSTEPEKAKIKAKELIFKEVDFICQEAKKAYDRRGALKQEIAKIPKQSDPKTALRRSNLERELIQTEAVLSQYHLPLNEDPAKVLAALKEQRNELSREIKRERDRGEEKQTSIDRGLSSPSSFADAFPLQKLSIPGIDPPQDVTTIPQTPPTFNLPTQPESDSPPSAEEPKEKIVAKEEPIFSSMAEAAAEASEQQEEKNISKKIVPATGKPAKQSRSNSRQSQNVFKKVGNKVSQEFKKTKKNALKGRTRALNTIGRNLGPLRPVYNKTRQGLAEHEQSFRQHMAFAEKDIRTRYNELDPATKNLLIITAGVATGVMGTTALAAFVAGEVADRLKVPKEVKQVVQVASAIVTGDPMSITQAAQVLADNVEGDVGKAARLALAISSGDSAKIFKVGAEYSGQKALQDIVAFEDAFNKGETQKMLQIGAKQLGGDVGKVINVANAIYQKDVPTLLDVSIQQVGGKASEAWDMTKAFLATCQEGPEKGMQQIIGTLGDENIKKVIKLEHTVKASERKSPKQPKQQSPPPSSTMPSSVSSSSSSLPGVTPPQPSSSYGKASSRFYTSSSSGPKLTSHSPSASGSPALSPGEKIELIGSIVDKVKEGGVEKMARGAEKVKVGGVEKMTKGDVKAKVIGRLKGTAIRVVGRTEEIVDFVKGDRQKKTEMILGEVAQRVTEKACGPTIAFGVVNLLKADDLGTGDTLTREEAEARGRKERYQKNTALLDADVADTSDAHQEEESEAASTDKLVIGARH